MKNSVTWLRISYWVGAISDGVVAAIMLAQTILARPSPLTHHLPEPPYRYAMGLAGSLMLGWTILLLWADREPVERRGVLMITVFVILGLMGCGLYAVSAGCMSRAAAGPILAFQVLLIALFASSYVASTRNVRPRGGAEDG